MSDPERRRLFIGLMSGTSMDAIDAALVALGDRQCELLAVRATAYPPKLQERLLAASRRPGDCNVDEVCRLDREVGLAFRDAALGLLEASGTAGRDVVAIGSHGQTLRHQPRGAAPYTLQIGDPNLIAHGTGITTVADFRRRDLAAGGEAAPLAPAFHAWLFGDEAESRVVLNLGGFANVTLLPAGGEPGGFDTGPANTLMDAWSRSCRDLPCDEDGRWASSGRVDEALLDGMLADPYFAAAPPKSTGFEYFNDDWLQAQLAAQPGSDPADVQATLCELSARTIADAVRRHAPGTGRVFACGGGVHNAELMRRIAAWLAPMPLATTAAAGLDPAWIEAAAFAWLAARRVDGLPGNLPGVTGAGAAVVLGGIYAGSTDA